MASRLGLKGVVSVVVGGLGMVGGDFGRIARVVGVIVSVVVEGLRMLVRGFGRIARVMSAVCCG
jgi:hypothetical protein